MSFASRTRWFQFSLRTLLVIVTLFCLGPGGFLVYHRRLAKREQAAVAKLREIPGQQLLVRPDWLRTQLARQTSGYVVGAAFPAPNTTNGDIAPVSDLSGLVWLNLNGTKITDEGLDPVLKLTHLTQLRLDETDITDAGLLKLARLKQLKTLNVYKTRVTDEGVKKLQAELPELDVIR
jgi:hypothetical protein